MPKNYTKEETEGKWITVKGRHILLKEGESVEDALSRSDRAMGKESKLSNKEKEIAKLKQQLEKESSIFGKAKIKRKIEMLEANWQGTEEEWKEHQKAKQEAENQKHQERFKREKEAQQNESRKKEESKRKNLEHELKTQPKEKVEQYKIVQKYNPMLDDYHVGIRKPSDIMTWKEAVKDDDSFGWGDFSKKDAENALKSGKITIYSSYPIKQGVFVSTSKIQAEQYAGGSDKKVYSKTIPLDKVAWISGDEGQYADIEKWNKEKRGK